MGWASDDSSQIQSCGDDEWTALPMIVRTCGPPVHRSSLQVLKMPIEILHHAGHVLFVSQRAHDLREALHEAADRGVDLSGAQLEAVDLSGSSLERARLDGA